MTTTDRPEPTSVVVFGAGAIGAITAGYLEQAGQPFTLIDSWHLNVETIRRRGLRVRRIDEEFIAHPNVIHHDELERLESPIGVLVLAMKSYDTEWVARLIEPYLATDAIVISAQNGINEDRVAAILGADRVVGCVVAMSGFLHDAGQVMCTTRRSKDAFIVGELDGRPSQRSNRLGELLSPVGNVEISDRIREDIWAKMLLNVMLNALAGVTGLETPTIWMDPRLVDVMIRLGGEAVAAATASGARIADLTPPGMPSGMALTPAAIAAAHSGDSSAHAAVSGAFAAMAAGRAGGEEGKASLLQDIVRGRRTEVDYLNGHIAALAASHGLAAPANVAITQFVHEIEYERSAPAPSNAERLLEFLGE